MSSSAEMKRVIAHAAEQLRAAIDVETGAHHRGQTIAAMGLAEGSLRLLASYLEVTDEPPGPKPARDERGRFLRSVDGSHRGGGDHLACYLRQVLIERGVGPTLRDALREVLDGPELTDEQIVDEVRHGVRACELLHQVREIAAGVDWLGEPVVEAHICCEHA